MVNRVILHIGMHKTGSSSVQMALQSYDDGHSVYAPLGDPNHSLAMYTAFSPKYADHHIWRRRGDTRSFIDAKRSEYRTLLAEALSREDRESMILSGEDMSMLGSEGAEAMIGAIRTQVADIRVLCYLRPPVSFAASFLQQQIRSGRKVVPRRVPTLYHKRLAPYVHLLGHDAIEAVAFRPAELTGGIVADVAARLGLDAARLPEQTQNESLPLDALRLMYLFNRNAEGPVDHAARHRMVAALQTAYAGHARPETAQFAAIADDRHLEYLIDTFGLVIDDGAAGATNDPATVEEYLALGPETDLDPLARLLSSGPKDARAMMAELYTKALQGEIAAPAPMSRARFWDRFLRRS